MQKRQFYLGSQFSLYKDRQGLKTSLKLILFRFYLDRTFILREDPVWNSGDPALTPKMPDPVYLAETSYGKQIEPEDM